MAVEVIAKIKQINNGKFFLIDAKDVEMSNGLDLETHLSNFSPGEGSNVIFIGAREPTETEIEKCEIFIDKRESSSTQGAVNNITSAFMDEVRAMFTSLKTTILDQQKQIYDLQARVTYLETLHGATPDVDTFDYLLLENGNTFLLENGNSLVIEKCKEETFDYLLLENGNIFLLENGNSLMIEGCENENALLLENGDTFLLENGYQLIVETPVKDANALLLENGELFLTENGESILLEKSRSALLLENGDMFLLENGQAMLLEKAEKALLIEDGNTFLLENGKMLLINQNE